MLTLILGSLIFLTALFVGFKVKKFYFERKKYYSDLNDFITYYENEIKSYKLRLSEITDNYFISRKGAFSSDLKKFVDSTVKKEGGNFVFSKKMLCAGDEETVRNFFGNIGKFDIEGELNNIKNFKTVFSERTDTVRKKSEKEGALYMKLSILTGLALMIIIL